MLTRKCCQRRKEDLLFKEVLNRSYYNFEQEGLYTCIATYIFYEVKEVSHHYIIIGSLNKWCKICVKRFLNFISTLFSSNMVHVTFIWQCLIILLQNIDFIRSYQSCFPLKYPRKVLIKMFKSTHAALRHLNYPFSSVQCVRLWSIVISIR